MGEENPLNSQVSLDKIIKDARLKLSIDNAEDVLMQACFKSSAQTLDECINIVDSMLHSDTKYLTRAERGIMLDTLNNLRAVYAHHRAMLIQKYDTNGQQDDTTQEFENP